MTESRVMMKYKILIAVCCILSIFVLMGCQMEQEHVITDVHEIITEDGIRVEFVAAEAFDTVLDIYLNLEDLVENRFRGDIYLTPIIGNRGGEIASSTAPAEIISRTDDGVVMFRSRHILDRSVEGQDLYFTIERISYYIIEFERGRHSEGGDIKLHWSAAFDVENNEMHIVADRLNIEYRDFIIREIRINPFTLLLIAESDMTAVTPEPEIRIITEDGIVAAVITSKNSRAQGWLLGVSTTDLRINYGYIDEDFLDLDSVISIEVAGEIIELR